MGIFFFSFWFKHQNLKPTFPSFHSSSLFPQIWTILQLHQEWKSINPRTLIYFQEHFPLFRNKLDAFILHIKHILLQSSSTPLHLHLQSQFNLKICFVLPSSVPAGYSWRILYNHTDFLIVKLSMSYQLFLFVHSHSILLMALSYLYYALLCNPIIPPRTLALGISSSC